jgi:hypothetical protein
MAGFEIQNLNGLHSDFSPSLSQEQRWQKKEVLCSRMVAGWSETWMGATVLVTARRRLA